MKKHWKPEYLAKLDSDGVRRAIQALPSAKLTKKSRRTALKQLQSRWTKLRRSGVVAKDASVDNALRLARAECAGECSNWLKMDKGTFGEGAIHIIETGLLPETLLLTQEQQTRKHAPVALSNSFLEAMKAIGEQGDVVEALLKGDDSQVRDRIRHLAKNKWRGVNQEMMRALAKGAPIRTETAIHLSSEESGETYSVITKSPGNQYRFGGVAKWFSGHRSPVSFEESVEFDSAWARMPINKSIPLPPGESELTADGKWARVTPVATFKWLAGPQTLTRKQFIVNGDDLTGVLVCKAEDDILSISLADIASIGYFAKRTVTAPNPSPSIGASFRIIKANAYRREVTGIVLKPEETDAQDEIYSEDVVLDSQRDYMVRYRKGSTTGLNHEDIGLDDEIALVESWIVPEDVKLYGRRLKKGTWMATVKVFSDDIWNDVVQGRLTGFSIGGTAQRVLLS